MSSEAQELFEIRPFKELDRSFILATWLRGLYYGNEWFQEIDKDIFMENYHRYLENLLKREGVETRVAALKEDPDTILGYVTLEPKRSAIHWVYVKSAWRNLGIMKRLIPGDERWIAVTHLTKLGKAVKPKEIKFNPFLA